MYPFFRGLTNQNISEMFVPTLCDTACGWQQWMTNYIVKKNWKPVLNPTLKGPGLMSAFASLIRVKGKNRDTKHIFQCIYYIRTYIYLTLHLYILGSTIYPIFQLIGSIISTYLPGYLK